MRKVLMDGLLAVALVAVWALVAAQAERSGAASDAARALPAAGPAAAVVPADGAHLASTQAPLRVN